MGCNCGGAKREQARQVRQAREAEKAQAPRRSGGPGDPGYYWTGPKRPPKTAE